MKVVIRRYEVNNKKDVREGSYFGYLEYVVNRHTWSESKHFPGGEVDVDTSGTFVVKLVRPV